MNWILTNHLHELFHIAAATFFITKGVSALWEYRNLHSRFVLNFSAMCLFSAGYAAYVVISHNLPNFGEFWIPWTTAGLVVTFSAIFLYLFTVGSFLAIRSFIFTVPLVLLGTLVVVAISDLLLYTITHRSFMFTPIPREGIGLHQLELGEGAYSLRIVAEILPVIFIVSIVWGVVYLLVHLIKNRSTDILIYIGLFMTAGIVVNESLVALSVYEGVYLLAFTKVFEVLRIHRDIKHRSLVQFERQLRQAEKEELERRVHLRTEQLEVANKELEAFAYSVSHDLRTPIRSIDGFSQILLNEYGDKLDTQGQNFLNRIHKGIQRMSNLIDDMLNLSKVTRREMNIQEVNLSALAHQVATDLQNSETGREVDFIIQDEIIVNADERLLRIVFENLIENAWKYTSKHASAIIEFGTLQQENGRVFFVRDNGVGFDMKYAQQLFEAFKRLHSSREYSGTGIGLATVQRIIQRHGGKIWTESDVGEGATFYFTIP